MPQTYVRAKVCAGARKERILKVAEGLYAVHVREKAQRGEATARVRELLAQELHAPVHALRLVTGATSPTKMFLFTNAASYEDEH